jgi:hypothetical protein
MKTVTWDTLLKICQHIEVLVEIGPSTHVASRLRSYDYFDTKDTSVVMYHYTP